mmetsp:Transcript_72898/g.200057  ORF Transcript_72898/g.200057 Transcript_72898/m.200057 type:complete len:577 (-) Transcript_72898:389-2119(-)
MPGAVGLAAQVALGWLWDSGSRGTTLRTCRRPTLHRRRITLRRGAAAATRRHRGHRTRSRAAHWAARPQRAAATRRGHPRRGCTHHCTSGRPLPSRARSAHHGGRQARLALARRPLRLCGAVSRRSRWAAACGARLQRYVQDGGRRAPGGPLLGQAARVSHARGAGGARGAVRHRCWRRASRLGLRARRARVYRPRLRRAVRALCSERPREKPRRHHQRAASAPGRAAAVCAGADRARYASPRERRRAVRGDNGCVGARVSSAGAAGATCARGWRLWWSSHIRRQRRRRWCGAHGAARSILALVRCSRGGAARGGARARARARPVRRRLAAPSGAPRAAHRCRRARRHRCCPRGMEAARPRLHGARPQRRGARAAQRTVHLGGDRRGVAARGSSVPLRLHTGRARGGGREARGGVCGPRGMGLRVARGSQRLAHRGQRRHSGVACRRVRGTDGVARRVVRGSRGVASPRALGPAGVARSVIRGNSSVGRRIARGRGGVARDRARGHGRVGRGVASGIGFGPCSRARCHGGMARTRSHGRRHLLRRHRRRARHRPCDRHSSEGGVAARTVARARLRP